MKLTEEQSLAILSAALDVAGSVSANRLKKAVAGDRQSSALVCPFALGKLAVAVEAVFPGGIVAVRKARIEREANARAERMAAYAAERDARDAQLAEKKSTWESGQPLLWVECACGKAVCIEDDPSGDATPCGGCGACYDRTGRRV